jgi:hypothetical protein
MEELHGQKRLAMTLTCPTSLVHAVFSSLTVVISSGLVSADYRTAMYLILFRDNSKIKQKLPRGVKPHRLDRPE